MDIKIKVRGLKELADELRNFGRRRVGALFKAAIQAGGTEWARVAKDLAPRQSGELRRSIKSTRMGTGSYFTAHSIIGTDVYYAWMQEKGWNVVRTGRYFPGAKKRWRRETRGSVKKLKNSRYAQRMKPIPAKPFMRPAFDTGKTRVLTKIGVKLGKDIMKEFAKLGRH